MNKKGYILIGMSGSGKTTLGRKLAHDINYKFIDSDRLIETKIKNPLQVIVNSYADKQDFINLEKSIIKNIILNKSVLATGGSTCYSNLELKKLNGCIVFLKISWKNLVKRIKNFNGRGVILLHGSFKDEYEYRQKLYLEFSDIIIDCDNKSINNLLDEIKFKIGFINSFF